MITFDLKNKTKNDIATVGQTYFKQSIVQNPSLLQFVTNGFKIAGEFYETSHSSYEKICVVLDVMQAYVKKHGMEPESKIDLYAIRSELNYKSGKYKYRNLTTPLYRTEIENIVPNDQFVTQSGHLLSIEELQDNFKSGYFKHPYSYKGYTFTNQDWDKMSAIPKLNALMVDFVKDNNILEKVNIKLGRKIGEIANEYDGFAPEETRNVLLVNLVQHIHKLSEQDLTILNSHPIFRNKLMLFRLANIEQFLKDYSQPESVGSCLAVIGVFKELGSLVETYDILRKVVDNTQSLKIKTMSSL